MDSAQPAATVSEAPAEPALPSDTQAVAEPAEGIGDIVITATRRETKLQRTPIAVSVVDQNLINQASPDNIGDLALYVPNFSAETITGFNAASFAMRGVGQNNIIVYFEPPVVVLVDDFVMPSVQTQLLDTFDVSQVEVLRGPQGTLFGKNSSGGAVTVRTKRPELDRLFADGEVSYGSFNTRSAKAAVNVPIGQIAALRIVGGYEKSDGYYKNGACYGPVNNFTVDDPDTPANEHFPSKFDGVSGCLNDGHIGGKDVVNARVKLLVQPTANLKALFQYEILRDRSGTVPSVNENELYTGTVPFLTDLLGIKAPNRSNDPLDNAGVTLRNDTFQRNKQRINVDGLYANLDYNFNIGTLTSVTGWRKQTSRLPNSYAGVTAVAADGDRLSVFDASRDDDRKTFQQELRFASNLGGPFDFVAGAFYQHDTVDFCVSQLLGFLDLASGPLPFGSWNDTPYILCNAQKAKSSAVFAEGNYKFTDRLTLTAGVRQTWDDKVWKGRQQTFIPTLEGGFDLGISLDEPLDASVYNYPVGVITLKDKSKKLTYRLSLGYQATDDIFVYATHATGYKGGGFNDQIGGFAAFGADLDAFREAARATKPETASSYEAGIKSDLLDHHLRANLTGFYVKYADLQKQLNVPLVVNGQPNQVTIFVNAASATVKGIEAELTAKPVSNLTMRAILGYQDAKYDKYSAPNAGYDLSTSPLDRAPKWQWTLAGNYAVPLGAFKVTFDGSIAYQSRNLFTQSITDPLGNTFLNARTLVDASITFADVEDRYYVRLIGQNLTDERYRTASQNVAGLWLNSQYGPPRFFGVQAGLHVGK
ncbi:MAG: TonB-dependent receptor [Sphingomicrobium sp.]